MHTRRVVVITSGRPGVGKATAATFAKIGDLFVIVGRGTSFVTDEVLKVNGGWRFGF